MKRPKTDPKIQREHEALTDLARERHDALTSAIERLEHALAAPAAQRAGPWSERVSAELRHVREAVRAHVESTEEEEGLFDRIETEHPRLAARVAALRDEHSSLVGRASGLAERLEKDAGAHFTSHRGVAASLLAAMRAHRAAEADLLYEAFWTDMGAVD